MLLGKLDIYMQKTEQILTQSGLRTLIYIRPETLKLVKESAEKTLELIHIGKNFLNRTQIAQQLRERVDKWDYIKLKSFCTTYEMFSKLKSLPTEWE
jgi:hypothetical protein